jgi:predicted O-methyltransferase YrrM
MPNEPRLAKRLKRMVPKRVRLAVTILSGRAVPTLRVSPEQIRRSFDYDRRLLPNAYLAQCDASVQSGDEAAIRTGLSIGYPAWNLLYYSLLCSLESPEPVVVETGTNRGFSTIVLAQALVDSGCRGAVHTVDIDPVVVEKAKENLDQAGLRSRVVFHVGDSVAFLQDLVAEVDRIDFAFLDSRHEADVVLREFESILPRVVACGGRVYFDNTTSGGVADALRRITRDHGGNLVEFTRCSWAPPGNAIWQP